MELLQRIGLVELESTPEDGLLPHSDTAAQQSMLDDYIKRISAALDTIEQYSPEDKPFLSSYIPRPSISAAEYADILAECPQGLEICDRLARLKKELDELRADRVRAQTRYDVLSPWVNLDIPMNYKGTAATAGFIGTIPGNMDSGALAEKLARLCPDMDGVYSEVTGAAGDLSCVFIMCMRDDADRLESTLRGMGFSRPSENLSTTAGEAMAVITREQTERDRRELALTEELCGFGEKRGQLRFILDACTVRLDKYRMIERLACGENCFILEGWTPDVKFDGIAAELESIGVYCERLDTKKGDDPPVMLKNNAFTEGGEPVVEMYSLPSKRDIDPTAIMSVWYYLLFGIMLGDAAYGLIMVLATGFVLLKFKPEARQRKNMKLFCFSGFSAIIWGVVFGSFFGDLPNVIARTFFGITEPVLTPLWFDPIKEPMQMMIFSIALGAIHVMCGLFLGIYTNLKNGDVVSALCGPGAWLLMLVSGIGWALIALMGDSLPFAVPEFVSYILLGLLALSVLTILLMGGRPTKSPFKRLLKGAYELYGFTSYISDFMSYSRLLALGLATGVISQVFNTIGTMFGGGAVGVIVLIIVGIIGHALNIGISLIGCYVHDCRLQYVEFFGKFYEGGGREFMPLTANTKYFKFKEEN